MGKPGPTVLFAEAAHLHRLMAEGGLRPSFLGIFRGTSVFDTVGEVPRGGGLALDALLRDFPLVAIDERLLLPPEPSAPDATAAAKFRDNFLRKIATRRQIRLVVLEGAGDAQVRALERLGRSPAHDPASPGWRAADVVIVLTTRMLPEVRAAIESLRDSPAIARIYLMTERLQTGREGLNLALADHVWPICVARLLAVRACMPAEPDPPQDAPVPMHAWRTFAWGVSSAAESQWEEQYLLAIRERLLPPTDDESDDIAAARRRQTMIVVGDARAAPVALPDYGWHDQHEDLQRRATGAIDDAALERLLEAAATTSGTTSGEEDEAAAMLRSNVQADWTAVATTDGLVHLRRLANGRLWPTVDVPDRSDLQQDGWRRLAARGMQLIESRDRHVAAVEELTVARSRYLPSGWRLIIAAATLCFVLQFLLATLLPLRPPATSLPFTGTAFMGLPVSGDSVGFLIDRSSSMQGKRLDRVKQDLARTIQGLPVDARFAVIAFSSNTSIMPGAAGGLVSADDAAKQAAIDWVNSLTADGTTVAAPGLGELLGMKPKSIILLTDGEFSDPDAVHDAVEEATREGTTRIDTVALYGRAGEDSLRRIAESTRGTYRFVAYDPFSPPGFDALLGLVVVAALLGAAIGLLLPWWLERRAGLRATRALRASEKRLLGELATHAHAAAKQARTAAGVALGRRSNATAARQRSLARRAMAAVDRAIGRVRADRRGPQATTSTDDRPGELVAEDRADLAAALDEPLPGAGDVGELHDVVRQLAVEHADALRTTWRELCDRHDPVATGHLPVRSIDDEFYAAVRNFFDAASMRGLGLVAGQTGSTNPLPMLANKLAERLQDDSHRPFMSAPVEARDGSMPGRKFVWVGIEAEAGDGRAAGKLLRDHVDNRVVITDGTDVDDLGVTALALIQEEIPVVIESGADETPRIVVAKDGR